MLMIMMTMLMINDDNVYDHNDDDDVDHDDDDVDLLSNRDQPNLSPHVKPTQSQ